MKFFIIFFITFVKEILLRNTQFLDFKSKNFNFYSFLKPILLF